MLNRDEQEFLKRLGRNVSRLRGGTTQEKLAEKSDLNIRTLQRIEKGEMNLKVTTVERLRQALDCSWEDLSG